MSHLTRDCRPHILEVERLAGLELGGVLAEGCVHCVDLLAKLLEQLRPLELERRREAIVLDREALRADGVRSPHGQASKGRCYSRVAPRARARLAGAGAVGGNDYEPRGRGLRATMARAPG